MSIGHYREAVGALLIFDLTNKETFDNLEYWIKEVKEHSKAGICIALIGNTLGLIFLANKFDLVLNDKKA